MNTKIPITTADSVPLYSPPHTIPNIFRRIYFALTRKRSIKNPFQYQLATQMTKSEIVDLVAKINKTWERDLGRHKAYYMGVDQETINQMTDEEFVQFNKEIQFGEPTRCYECGQKLPE